MVDFSFQASNVHEPLFWIGRGVACALLEFQTKNYTTQNGNNGHVKVSLTLHAFAL